MNVNQLVDHTVRGWEKRLYTSLLSKTCESVLIFSALICPNLVFLPHFSCLNLHLCSLSLCLPVTAYQNFTSVRLFCILKRRPSLMLTLHQSLILKRLLSLAMYINWPISRGLTFFKLPVYANFIVWIWSDKWAFRWSLTVHLQCYYTNIATAASGWDSKKNQC